MRRRSRKKYPIDPHDETDIKCLLMDIDICQYRMRLSHHFGSEVELECPLRKRLREKFNNWHWHRTYDDEYER